MSQFSQLIGSFERTGNFPMEANYIFNSVEELNEWASDPINHATLHKGLQKVVESDEFGLRLYWVVEKDGDLVFERYFCTSEAEEADKHFDLVNTTYQVDNEGILLTLKLGSDVWNEFIPMSDVIHTLEESFGDQISKDQYINSLEKDIRDLQGQMLAILQTVGVKVDHIDVISFRFVGKDEDVVNYIVDTSKLTEEEKENGLSIPIEWEYSMNFYNSDKLYLYINNKRVDVPNGSDTSYTLENVKENTSVYLYGVNKASNIQTKSKILKILFGLIFYVGDSGDLEITSLEGLSQKMMTPNIEGDTTVVDLTLDKITSDNYRVFAVPNSTYELVHLYLKLGDLLCKIEGFDTVTLKDSDNLDYTTYRLHNKIHGNYTIKIANNNLI